jgi:hypothetical protein
MKIVIDIDPDTYEEIKSLVAAGSYESVKQFLRAAADNQLTIEASEGSRTAAVGSSDGSPEIAAASSTSQSYPWGYDPAPEAPARDPHPADRHELLLFSQFYRFLPLKFALSELADITADSGSPVKLDEFRDHASEAVIPVRDALANWEDANDISKQNRLSTGFPKRDSSDPERTMRRYLNHYVGHYSSGSESPSGFGHQLGLVSIQREPDSPTTIALTPAGAAFVELTNPVLADGPAEERASLSESERNYLVAHIRANLDLEYEFMNFVYGVLENHEGTYTGALDHFRTFLEDCSQFTEAPSENRVRSHTAGTISRMVALGVLRRGTRRGVYETGTPLDSYRYPSQIRDRVPNTATATDTINQ